MIHKHVNMRDLLRNPNENLPQTPDEQVIVSRGGFPMYAVSMLNISATVGDNNTKNLVNPSINLVKSSEGKITIHEHKK